MPSRRAKSDTDITLIHEFKPGTPNERYIRMIHSCRMLETGGKEKQNTARGNEIHNHGMRKGQNSA